MENKQQPEALRLADQMESKFCTDDEATIAEELRRLHAESERHLQELRSYRITVENREARIAELEAQLAAVQQGVPADALIEHLMQRIRLLPQTGSIGEMQIKAILINMQAATHPTQQGLDALHKQMLSALESVGSHTITDCDGDEIEAYFCNWQAIRDAKRAAQAKQGEQA